MDERDPWIQALLRTVGEHSPMAGGTGPLSEGNPLGALWPHEPDVIALIDSALMISCTNAAGRALLAGSGPWGVADLFHAGCAQGGLGLLQAGFYGDCEGPVALVDGRQVSLSVRQLSEDVRLLVMRDVSRVHRRERARQLVRRHAEVSKLASDLAADVATPLAIIEGRIALLQAQPDISPQDLREQLFLLKDHSRRISQTVRNLQAVALTRAPKPEHIRLSGLIDNCVAELGRRLQRIRLERDIPPEALIYADPGHARQILTNLMIAALERTSARGTIRIESVKQGSETAVSVLDEGPPLHSSFLTTSLTDVDTLLADPGVRFSMAITWMLVRRNGGSLTMQCRPHRGAAFSMKMMAQPTQQLAQRPPQILVLDPGELLAETVRWMLQADPYSVISAVSLATALYRAGRHAPRAILVDCSSPSNNGAALLAVLRSEQPELAERVIQVKKTSAEGTGLHLSKPFTRQQLLAVLRQLG